MIILLEKEVVKYTKEGIRKQNLVTGETKMLTKSDYASQIKYAPNKENVYKSKNKTGKSVKRKVYTQGADKEKTVHSTKYYSKQTEQPIKDEKNKKTANYTYGKYDNNKSKNK